MSDNIQETLNENESFLATKFFSQQWQLYQKVLNNNYMGHREIYAVLHEILLNNLQEPFKMLELGCGDASFTTQALLNTQISEYTGIDLSVPALEGAEKNFSMIDCQTNFITGDCWELAAELTQNQDRKFDIILVSFALHHLQLQDKDSLIKNLQKLLTPGGVFILIDIISQQQEDRNNYLRRYLDNVARTWSLLTPAEYIMVESHMSTSDFPETQQTLKSIAEKSGFSDFQCVYRDCLDTTELLCFYK